MKGHIRASTGFSRNKRSSSKEAQRPQTTESSFKDRRHNLRPNVQHSLTLWSRASVKSPLLSIQEANREQDHNINSRRASAPAHCKQSRNILTASVAGSLSPGGIDTSGLSDDEHDEILWKPSPILSKNDTEDEDCESIAVSTQISYHTPSVTVSVNENALDCQSNSSDYDTDLEEEFPVQCTPPFDRTGKDVYLKQCRNVGLIPISFLIDRLGHQKLRMRHHGLGPLGAFTVAKALINNSYIEELDLSENDLQVDGAISFAAMLHENTFITDLTLSENALLPAGGIVLARVLEHNNTIQRLVLTGNGFDDKVAKAFAEILKRNKTLQELDLSYNNIGEQGGLYLGAGLALNYGLQILKLKWNGICSKGGVSIAASLRKNESLTSLDISWNGLAFIGCLAFGTHIAKNATLKHIDLSNNRIGPTGAAKLAPALSVHPTLEVFKIGINPIGDEGVLHILKAVKKNSSIKLIGLEDITVSANTHQSIMELENTRDITIVIGGLGGYSKGKPPPSGIKVLVQFIQDNRMRLSDLFFQWDKDKSGDISKEEFQKGLLETGLKMEKYQLHALVEQLDLNDDGLISFAEIIAGRDAEMLERRFQRRVAVRTEERERESIRLPRLKGF